jgi:hypothetical protein
MERGHPVRLSSALDNLLVSCGAFCGHDVRAPSASKIPLFVNETFRFLSLQARFFSFFYVAFLLILALSLSFSLKRVTRKFFSAWHLACVWIYFGFERSYALSLSNFLKIKNKIPTFCKKL